MGSLTCSHRSLRATACCYQHACSASTAAKGPPCWHPVQAGPLRGPPALATHRGDCGRRCLRRLLSLQPALLAVLGATCARGTAPCEARVLPRCGSQCCLQSTACTHAAGSDGKPWQHPVQSGLLAVTACRSAMGAGSGGSACLPGGWRFEGSALRS